jgi:hypothetical protein
MKTAVEWFAKELYEKFEMKGDGKVFDDLLEQANEMHKKQIILAHGIKDTGVNNMKCVTGEQYYNETFKQQEQ